AGVECVRWIGTLAIAGRDIENAVLAKARAPAVMAAGLPCDNHVLVAQIDARRIRFGDFEPRNNRALRKLWFENIPDIDVTVLGELRMKRDAINFLNLVIPL